MSQDRIDFNFTDVDTAKPVRLRLAAMIDVVFLLICFFMMTSQMIRQQDDPTVNLPEMVNHELRPENPVEMIGGEVGHGGEFLE